MSHRPRPQEIYATFRFTLLVEDGQRMGPTTTVDREFRKTLMKVSSAQVSSYPFQTLWTVSLTTTDMPSHSPSRNRDNTCTILSWIRSRFGLRGATTSSPLCTSLRRLRNPLSVVIRSRFSDFAACQTSSSGRPSRFVPRRSTTSCPNSCILSTVIRGTFSSTRIRTTATG